VNAAVATERRIVEAVERVRERVALACQAVGRQPSEITLIAATKTRPAEDLVVASGAGITDFGENYVQEGAAKFLEFARLAPDLAIARHCIGHLQRNKVNAALAAFDVFHGLDSIATLSALGHRSTRSVPAFLEVNLAGEPAKHGFAPSDLPRAVEEALAIQSVSLLGFMAIPPPGPPDESRQWFAQLRELAHGLGVRHLSMGMTEDFDIAIEEGATHVRVGRAIFGERRS
jgi:pyridoxal phosphate enzyme (YggS family)